MNAYTLAARETVREIRESLSRQEPTLEVLQRDLDTAMWHLGRVRPMFSGAVASIPAKEHELIELWASLAADLAGMIQQKEKAL